MTFVFGESSFYDWLLWKLKNKKMAKENTLDILQDCILFSLTPNNLLKELRRNLDFE